jgi:hypothetical protein
MKLRINFEASEWLTQELEAYHTQHPELVFVKDQLEGLILNLKSKVTQEKEPEKPPETSAHSQVPPRLLTGTLGSQGAQKALPTKEDLDRAGITQANGIYYSKSGLPIDPSRIKKLLSQEATVPFETSENLQTVSTEESTTMNSGNNAGKTGKQTGKPTLQERLWFHEQKAAIYRKAKVETAKEMEQARQVVREQARRYHNRPILNDVAPRFGPCPLGHNANFCANSLCSNRGECNKPTSGIHTVKHEVVGETPEFALDYIR